MDDSVIVEVLKQSDKINTEEFIEQLESVNNIPNQATIQV
jgi:hypothetical protein